MFAVAILLCCQLAGELIASWSGLPVPGPVIGMALLLGGLMINGRLPDSLARTATTLLGILTLLFIPPAVGVILHLDEITRELLPLSVVIIAGTLLTMAVAGGIMQALAPRPPAPPPTGDIAP